MDPATLLMLDLSEIPSGNFKGLLTALPNGVVQVCVRSTSNMAGNKSVVGKRRTTGQTTKSPKKLKEAARSNRFNADCSEFKPVN